MATVHLVVVRMLRILRILRVLLRLWLLRLLLLLLRRLLWLLLLLRSEATIHIGSRHRVAATPTAAPVATLVALACFAPLALAAVAFFWRLAISLQCAARGGCFTHYEYYTY